MICGIEVIAYDLGPAGMGEPAGRWLSAASVGSSFEPEPIVLDPPAAGQRDTLSRLES